MIGEKILNARGIVLAQVTQPPCNRLLNKPLWVFDIAHGPAEDALADRKLIGFWVILLGVGQGDDHSGAASPVDIGFGPALHHFDARGVRDEALLACHHSVIRDGPAVKVRNP